MTRTSAPPAVPQHAMVLTAGLGIRLRPLTLDRAKPAVPVCGEPLVRRILRWLARAGVRHVVLNLHHQPQSVAAAVGDGRDLGVSVRYSWEQPTLLGSAGGPRLALPLLETDPFLIVNGDTLTDVDLAALSAAHAASGALVTMAVVPHPAPDRYGGVLVDADGRVQGFAGPGSGTGARHFVGVQIATAEAFSGLPAGRPAAIVRTLYPSLIATRPGSVRAFESPAGFVDIGTPADYLAASLALAASAQLPDPGRGRGVQVGPGARVERSILWDEVHVGRDSHLVECIVADGVVVPDGTRLTRCAVVRADDHQPTGSERRDGDLLIAPFELAACAPSAAGLRL